MENVWKVYLISSFLIGIPTFHLIPPRLKEFRARDWCLHLISFKLVLIYASVYQIKMFMLEVLSFFHFYHPHIFNHISFIYLCKNFYFGFINFLWCFSIFFWYYWNFFSVFEIFLVLLNFFGIIENFFGIIEFFWDF